MNDGEKKISHSGRLTNGITSQRCDKPRVASKGGGGAIPSYTRHNQDSSLQAEPGAEPRDCFSKLRAPHALLLLHHDQKLCRRLSRNLVKGTSFRHDHHRPPVATSRTMPYKPIIDITWTAHSQLTFDFNNATMHLPPPPMLKSGSW